MPEPLRIVLDTNVVLDLLHFHDAGVAAIDAAIRSGAVHAVTDAACLEELRRVLGYPEFGLEITAREALLARYRQCTLMVEPAAGVPAVPAQLRCSDPDDQKFIDLALRCGAAFLVSKDRAVLRMARRVARLQPVGGCLVVAPPAFLLPA
jgi:putative PIN family toxin of toxin-antitoxin system